MRKNEKTVDMTKGPYFKKIFIYAIPVILTGFLQQFYNMADLIVVGQLVNANALSAIGCTNPITSLAIGFFFGLAIGGGVTAAHCVGAKRENEVREVLHTAFIMSAVLGVIVAVVGVIFARDFLLIMDTPDDILDMSVMYMQIVFCGVPAQLIYTYLAAILRACGDSKRPLIFLSIAGVFNIVFNVICIAVFGLGVAGVALSTAIAHYLSLALILIYLMRQNGYLHFSFKYLRINVPKMKKMLKIGIPSGIQGTLFNLSNASIQAALNSFGSDVVAGVTAAGSLMSLITMSMSGLYEASVTFVGQNYGAGEYKNIKKVLLNCLIITFIIGNFVSLVTFVFRYPLINMFTDGNEAVTEAAMSRYLIMGPPYFIYGLFDATNGALRAIGKSMTSMVISIFGIIVLRLVWLETVFVWVKTPECLYWSYPASWFVTMVVSMVVFAIFYKRLLKYGTDGLEIFGGFRKKKIIN